MGCGASQPAAATAASTAPLPEPKPGAAAPASPPPTAPAAAAPSDAPPNPAPPAQKAQATADVVSPQQAATADTHAVEAGTVAPEASALNAAAAAADATDAVVAGSAAPAAAPTHSAAGAAAAQDGITGSDAGAAGAPTAAAAAADGPPPPQSPQEQQQLQQQQQQVLEDEESLLALMANQQEAQLKAIAEERGAGAGENGGGKRDGPRPCDPAEVERLRRQQEEVQQRLDGLTPEQIQLLKLKLQQRLEQQLTDFNTRMKAQQADMQAEAEEEERRAAERARRKAEADAARPARQAAYEQELLAAVLLPGQKGLEDATAAAAGAAAAGGEAGPEAAAAAALPTIAVKAWTGDSGDDGLLFPETDDLDFKIAGFSRRPNVALCLGGGGSAGGCAGAFHAAAAGLGWLRALHQLGLLGKAQYAAAGGGGAAWLLGPIWFHGGQQPGGSGSGSGSGAAGAGDGGGGGAGGAGAAGAAGQEQQQQQQQEAVLAELLGAPARAPEECSLEALQGAADTGGRSYLGLLAGAVAPLGGLAARLAAEAAAAGGSEEVAAAWSQGVSEALLAPWGLGGDCTAVTSANTKGKVHESVAVRAAALGRTLLTAHSGLPYPLICQSIALTDGNSDTSVHQDWSYYPYEWSPLYGGCPVSYGTTAPRLGGGWVESLGANAELVAKPATAAASGCEVRVRPRGGPGASLADAVAVASLAAAGAAASGASFGGGGDNSAPGAGPPPLRASRAYFDQQGWENASGLSFTDGGCTAATAVYPALRRRVKNLIVLITSRSAIAGDQASFCLANRELSALFGRWPGADRPGMPAADVYNKQCQVFDSGAFEELHGALAAKAAAGQPTAFLGEYEVLANAHCGVPGGWAVRVLWLVASGAAAEVAAGGWAAALPSETRTALLVEDTFPFAAGVMPRAGAEAVQQLELVASHAASQLLAVKELAAELFEEEEDEDDE